MHFHLIYVIINNECSDVNYVCIITVCRLPVIYINDKLITWINKSHLNLLNKIFNKSSFNTTADTFCTQTKGTAFLPESVTSKTAMNEKATAFDTEKNKQMLCENTHVDKHRLQHTQLTVQ